MAATFNGSSIFGQFERVTSVSRPYRAQRSQLPAVNGVRLYRLGKDVQTWTVRGRLISTGAAGLMVLIRNGQALVDGLLYTFVDTGGVSHTNCTLTDFRIAGQIQTIILPNNAGAATVVVQATIEQVVPDI